MNSDNIVFKREVSGIDEVKKIPFHITSCVATRCVTVEFYEINKFFKEKVNLTLLNLKRDQRR